MAESFIFSCFSCSSSVIPLILGLSGSLNILLRAPSHFYIYSGKISVNSSFFTDSWSFLVILGVILSR